MKRKLLVIVLSLSLLLGLATVSCFAVDASEIELKEKTTEDYVFSIGSNITDALNNGYWGSPMELRLFNGSTQLSESDYSINSEKTEVTIAKSKLTEGSLTWQAWATLYGGALYQGSADLLPAGPTLTQDSTNNTADKDGKLTKDLVITFEDDETWRAAITGVKIKKTSNNQETVLTSEQYSVAAGSITINKDVIVGTGAVDTYLIYVSATEYKTASVYQVINPTILKLTATIDDEKKYIDSDIVYHLAYAEADSALAAEWMANVTGVESRGETVPMKGIVNDTTNHQINLTIDGTVFSSAGYNTIEVTTANTKIAVRFGYTSTFSAKIETVGDFPAFYLANKDNFFYGDDIIITYPESSKEAYKLWSKNYTKAEIWVPGYERVDVTSLVVIDDENKTIVIPASEYTKIFNEGEQYSMYIYFDATGYGETSVYAYFVLGQSAPVVVPQSNAVKDAAATLSFTDNEAWRNAITQIKVRNPWYSKSYPTVLDVVSEGLITIPASIINMEGEFEITISAKGYEDVVVYLGVGENYQTSNKSNYSDTTMLKVVQGETTVELSESDLYTLMFEEGAKNYTYSVCNTWPTFEIYSRANGPTIKGILEKAGIDVSALDKDQLVVFTASDGYKVAIKVSELLSENRYYYPNAGLAKEAGFKGSSEAAYADAVSVPAIIQLNHDNGTLRIGQCDPQDEQKDSCIRYMVSSSTPGTIEILDTKASKFEAPTISPVGSLDNGDVIGFSFSKEGFVQGTYQRALIYYTYTTDGTEPEDPIDANGKLSSKAILFNYAQYKNEEGQDVYNYLTIDSDDYIVKAVVVGRDHIASDIVTFVHTHSYAQSWTTNEEYHWHAALCEHSSEYSEMAKHDWDNGTVIKAAGCTTKGSMLYTCKTCGYEKTVEISATGHEYSEDWTSDESAHWHCAICEHTTEIAEKDAHDWDKGTITKAATTKEAGVMTYTCIVCGATKTEEIAQLKTTEVIAWITAGVFAAAFVAVLLSKKKK